MAMTGEISKRTARACVAGLFIMLLAAADKPGEGVEARAEGLLARLDALSAREEMTEAARARAFLDIAEGAFDIDRLAEMSLPREVALSAAQWRDYLQAFRRHLSLAYAESVRRHGPTRSRLVGVRRREDAPPIVVSETRTGGGPETREGVGPKTRTGTRTRRSVWVLCAQEGFSICAVEVEGVRIATRNRARFGEVLAREGVDGLLKALRSGALVAR